MNRSLQAAAAAASTLALTLALGACARNEAATPTAAAAGPQVSVASAVAQAITEYDQFTGRIQPVERVEIRPRVSGYIASVEFTEGREVKKGDVLFTIDPRPYEAELKRAKAELARAVTARTLANTEHDRALKLLNLRAISQEEYDTRVAGSEQADANVEAAQAAEDAAQLNLTFTRVRAPISGLISRAEVTAGNLVSSGDTLLTTLVSIDPVYVEFQGDEQMYLKYARDTRKQANGKPVWVGLANEEGYPHQGAMVFLDNELDPATGTVRVRGKLDNRQRIYTPGMFARIKVSGTGEQQAVLVRDSAVGTDQNVRYVLVVDAQNKVEYRAVKLGPAIDGLRVVREGLQAGENIVVNGLQRVRPGVTVTPQMVSMNVTAANDALASVIKLNQQGTSL
ncbi:MAG: efflux RND transporter periplasmic adaptor subunit [Steroidobacteraceae bacterium]